MDNALIRAEGIKKRYGKRDVLNGIDFSAERKKITYIFGTSGGGKSTLLKILIGALAPDHGTVSFNDDVITGLDDRSLEPFRRRMGMLFQHGALLNSLTVGENIALPMREHTMLDENIVKIMVKMKLELVGLRDFEELLPG
ncbi:MAG TPA: ATP-binding cassette domain-containing protein, partial [Nitrospirota bacterium]|nr:ATP-binding cassette domain-containing protein [Nitrospirota bacterium]